MRDDPNSAFFVQCPNHPLAEPMLYDSITDLHTCTIDHCPVVIRVMNRNTIVADCKCTKPCNVPWHQPPEVTDPMPSITFTGDDVLALTAIEAYRIACLSRNRDDLATSVTILRGRFVLWQQRNIEKVRKPAGLNTT